MTKANYDFINSPLPILYSARIRLNEEQRKTLKEAHQAFRHKSAPAVVSPVMAGSSISVETNVEPSTKSYEAFGLSSLIVNDLIVSRDTIALTVVLKLQQMLEVEVITRKTLEDAFQNYLDYVLSYEAK